MRVIVSHLTRMQPGYFCVAGIDPESGRHVRPAQHGRLPNRLLRKNGGIFQIGALVDLGAVTAVGAAPELEDQLFSEQNLRFDSLMKPTAFWNLLKQTQHNRLTVIFGDALEEHGRAAAVNAGSGTASLGCLTPQTCTIDVDPWDKVRLDLSDGRLTPRLSVTDIRVYEEDQKTVHQHAFKQIKSKLSTEIPLLSVGLARAWLKPRDTEKRHWLQVNNVHFESDPLGKQLTQE